MKLLFVTSHYLDEFGGGVFASLAYANAFAELAEECKIIYPFRGKNIIAGLSDKYSVCPVDYRFSRISKFTRLLLNQEINYLGDSFKHVLKKFNPDVVVFDNSRASAKLIEEVSNQKVIVIHHNFEKEYLQANIKRAFIDRYVIKLVNKAEKKALYQSDLNITLTEYDKNKFIEYYLVKDKSKVVNLGCFNYQNERLMEITNTHERQYINHLVFSITGNLSAKQTLDSLIPFIKEYWSEVLKIFPNAELLIAGKKPTEELLLLGNEYNSIKIIANPIDIDSIVISSDIYICPLKDGGGMKLRVQDGLKNGKIVISHKNSVRGYEICQEQNIVLPYSNLDDFIRLIHSINISHTLPSKETIIANYNDIFSFTRGVDRLRTTLNSSKLI